MGNLQETAAILVDLTQDFSRFARVHRNWEFSVSVFDFCNWGWCSSEEQDRQKRAGLYIARQVKTITVALGLIQPLPVQKIDGKLGALAGRRRHAALMALAASEAQKGFTKTTKVDCRLVPEDCDGTIMSENNA